MFLVRTKSTQAKSKQNKRIHRTTTRVKEGGVFFLKKPN